MRHTVRFFINRTENISGPSIFGHRLKIALIKKGWHWDRFMPRLSYLFSAGFFRPFCVNVLRLNGLYIDSQNTIGDSDKLNRPIFQAYTKADGIIFQSEFSRLLFKKFVGDPKCPHTVIHNGVPSNFSPEGEKINYGFNKVIICSGRWTAHKRFECVIDGFITLGDPEVGLIFLGDKPDHSLIKHPNIKYIGHIDPNELPKYLRGGDAFIDLEWLGSCPNTVVEAIACGLPVLCSNNGGTRELVKSNGIVLYCEEEYDFKKVNLYNPPKCDNKIIAEGIEKILSWSKPIDTNYFAISKIAGEYMEFGIGIQKNNPL